MEDADVDAIVEVHQAGKESEGEGGVKARIVEHAEMKDNGWDLNISRYVKTSAGEGVDVPGALAQLAAAQASLREAEARLEERLKGAGYA